MKCIKMYLFFSFFLTWLIWISIINFEFSDSMYWILMYVSVLMPALALGFTKILTKNEKILFVSLKSQISESENIKWYLIAWLLPVVIIFCGGLLYYCIFQNDFTFTFGWLQQDIINKTGQFPDNPLIIANRKILVAVFIYPFMNMFLCLGEEIGWRGFLFPALIQHISRNKTHILVGIIWGVWHTPLIIMGNNYGLGYLGYPWLGVLTLCIFTFSTGVFLSWLTENSSTIWPAALAHGTINSLGGLPYLFLTVAESHNRLLGPGITGLISGLPMVILASILIIKEKQLKN